MSPCGAGVLARVEPLTDLGGTVLDKPIVMGSVDDPNSKRTYQLEATLTKLK